MMSVVTMAIRLRVWLPCDQMEGLLRIRGASQIVQVCKEGEKVLRGAAMKSIAILQNEGDRKVGVVVDKKGRIASIGYDDELDTKYSGSSFDSIINAKGGSVIPGLVDAHTHPVWVGDRVNEFVMKLAGATYMDIHSQGGGIHYTVNCVRQATQEELLSSLKTRLTAMMKYGTTTIEAKSGYGLDLHSEIKMLQAIKMAEQEHPMSLSVTFCGAHAVPKGSTAEETTQNVVNEQIPAISSLCEAGDLLVHNIDVFCEKGVFDTDQSRRILMAGKKAGWRINFHGDELHPMNSGELAGELEAAAVSHLEQVSDTGIVSMVNAGTIGILLPTTAYILRLKYPPARKMIDKGMAIALGSDFNPNAYCMSMPLVMHLACVNMHMTMEESLAAATINGAASLGVAEECGSIEVGKKADMIILYSSKWEHLVYQLGCHDQCISHVVKNGEVVYSTN